MYFVNIIVKMKLQKHFVPNRLPKYPPLLRDILWTLYCRQSDRYAAIRRVLCTFVPCSFIGILIPKRGKGNRSFHTTHISSPSSYLLHRVLNLSFIASHHLYSFTFHPTLDTTIEHQALSNLEQYNQFA